MALKDNIEKHTYVLECTVVRLLAKLNLEDRNTLLEAIEKGVPTMTLVAALREEGYKIGEPTFNLHRYGKCRCKKN
jgi:hypothetical protein